VSSFDETSSKVFSFSREGTPSKGRLDRYKDRLEDGEKEIRP